MESETGYIKDAPERLALWPHTASSMAGPVDYAFYGLIGVSVIIIIVIGVVILVYSIRYREGSRADRSSRLTERQTLWIEMAWGIPTLIVFLALFFWAGALYIQQYAMPAEGVPVNVIAKQWMWKVQHANGAREINELHVPVGEKILLRLTSQDVIHSFYIPAFRTKRDVLPERYTTFWFEATKPGVYSLFCAEYCGVDHSRMRGRVVAMEAAAFERWLSEQAAPDAPAARGRELFTAYGCAGCHAPGSETHAPDLDGLYGRPVHLADGSTTTADHGYIRDSILLPKKDVVAGYQPIMPSYQEQIGESEILAIIAYLRSLSEEGENAT